MRRIAVTTYLYHITTTFVGVVLFELVPAHAEKGNFLFNLLINIIFEVALIIAIFFSLRKSNWRDLKALTMPGRLAWVVLIISILSVVLIGLDRVMVRGIDYSNGFREARYLWLNSEGGNPLGVIGNLLSTVPYAGIYIGIRFKCCLSYLQRNMMLGGAFLGVLLHSMLNGGRSNILIALSMAIFAKIIGDNSPGVSISRSIETKKNDFFVYLVISVVLLTYVVAIVINSSNMANGSGVMSLLVLGAQDLGGYIDDNWLSNNPSDISMVFLYMLIYLFHGQWTAQDIYSLDESYRNGFYSLSSAPTLWLEKIGVVNIDSDKLFFSNTGAFVSLPGSLFYDFGYAGVVIGALLLGWIFVLSLRWFLSGDWGVVFLYCTSTILLFSPIVPAYGLVYFFYAALGFISLKLISSIFRIKFKY